LANNEKFHDVIFNMIENDMNEGNVP